MHKIFCLARAIRIIGFFERPLRSVINKIVIIALSPVAKYVGQVLHIRLRMLPRMIYFHDPSMFLFLFTLFSKKQAFFPKKSVDLVKAQVDLMIMFQMGLNNFSSPVKKFSKPHYFFCCMAPDCRMRLSSGLFARN